MIKALVMFVMFAVIFICMYIRTIRLERKNSSSTYCHKCGTKLSGGNYCPNCGTQVGSAPNYSNGKRVLLILICLVAFMILVTAVCLVFKVIDTNKENDENGTGDKQNSSACGERTEQVVYCENDNVGIEYEGEVYQYENTST